MSGMRGARTPLEQSETEDQCREAKNDQEGGHGVIQIALAALRL